MTRSQMSETARSMYARLLESNDTRSFPFPCILSLENVYFFGKNYKFSAVKGRACTPQCRWEAWTCLPGNNAFGMCFNNVDMRSTKTIFFYQTVFKNTPPTLSLSLRLVYSGNWGRAQGGGTVPNQGRREDVAQGPQ